MERDNRMGTNPRPVFRKHRHKSDHATQTQPGPPFSSSAVSEGRDITSLGSQTEQAGLGKIQDGRHVVTCPVHYF